MLRNGLVTDGLAGAGLVLAYLGFIAQQVGLAFGFLAIPLGSYHWGREALEDLVRERVIGIDLLMLAATVGSCILTRSGRSTRRCRRRALSTITRGATTATSREALTRAGP